MLIPWFKGVLIGMPTLLVTLGLLTGVPFGMDFVQLFSWAWLRITGWPMLPGILAVIVVNVIVPSSHSRIRSISGVFSGIATVYMIWTSLILDPGFEDYHSFLTPFIWISAMGISSLLVDQGARINHWIRYVVLTGVLLLPSLFTFIPVLYFSGERFMAWVLAVVFAIGSSSLVFLYAKGIRN